MGQRQVEKWVGGAEKWLVFAMGAADPAPLYVREVGGECVRTDGQQTCDTQTADDLTYTGF